MNPQFPDRIPSGGNVNVGNIHIEAPVAGGIVQIGPGNRIVIQLQVLGAKDATLRLDQQNPLLQQLIQTLADGNAQANALASGGFSPNIATPCLRPEDLGRDAPFSSPLGIPDLLSWDAEEGTRNFSSLDGFLQQLDQQFGGTVASLTDGQQSLNLGDLLLQKGNLALWRFRQGALRLFAEQASLYALAEPQNPMQPVLETFQTAARMSLDVLRGWLLFRKYRTRQPALMDQETFSALSQGHWQTVLDSWSTEQRLAREQVLAERSYLNAIGQRYDQQAVQMAAHQAEWYFTEALRRQPSQSVALINLAVLLSESVLLSYIETGMADRARLEQARNLFQQAHTLLDQRTDREGQIALAQCLLYEAISLPAYARLETVQWPSGQVQQLYSALGQNAPGSVRWDIVQRNLARRDPDFFDRKKIEQARELLMGAGAMTVLVTIAEQWLDTHAQMVEFYQGTIQAGGAHQQPFPTHSTHQQPSPVHSAHQQPLPAHSAHYQPAPIHSVHHQSLPTHSAHVGTGTMSHSTTAAKVTSKGVVQKLLGTTIGKVIAVAVVTTVVAASVAAVVLTHRTPYPLLASAYQGTARNITFGVTSTIALTSIVQNQQEVSGNVIWGPGLIGNGPFTGTIGTDGGVSFTDTPSAGTFIIILSGSLHTDGSLSGTYTAPSANQQGVWQTTPESQ